ncbi:MAG: MFS transporter [Clostridiaceae bacterium]|nr:MFS transporter [Clostridiaceae bacterium]
MGNEKIPAAGRHFCFFLTGQGFLSLGESMRTIAITMLIYGLTGSGVSAAAGVVFSSLPGIFVSPFAGVLGDRAREGRLLIFIDIARFVTVPLFLYAGNVTGIYLLLVLISIFDVIYNPSRKKFILGSTGRENALKANSQLTGVSGAAYLAGPLLAGFLTDSRSAAPALILASLCCLLSGLMTLLAMLTGGGCRGAAPVEVYESGSSAFMNGIKYCLDTPAIVELLGASMIIGFCTISVNLSFYPFAFDVIKVTAKGWSLMITILYGTELLAMLLMRFPDKRSGMKDGRLFYSCLTGISLIWILYAFTRSYGLILLLQFVEGVFTAIAGIILAARLQMITGKQYMARATGLNDVISSAGKLAGMGLTVLVLSGGSFKYVFISCGILMFAFASIRRIRPNWAGVGRKAAGCSRDIRAQ